MAKAAKKVRPALTLKITARYPLPDLHPEAIQAASANAEKVRRAITDLGFTELEFETRFGNMRQAAEPPPSTAAARPLPAGADPQAETDRPTIGAARVRPHIA